MSNWAQALGSMAGTALGGWTNSYSSKKQDSYNRAAADKEWDRNLEAWNMENEYNTPKNQIARLKDAGLNPMLIYSNGGPQVVSKSSISTPHSIPRQVPQYGESISNALTKYLTTEHLQAQNDIAKRTARGIEIQNQQKLVQLELMQHDVDVLLGRKPIGTASSKDPFWSRLGSRLAEQLQLRDRLGEISESINKSDSKYTDISTTPKI